MARSKSALSELIGFQRFRHVFVYDGGKVYTVPVGSDKYILCDGRASDFMYKCSRVCIVRYGKGKVCMDWSEFVELVKTISV